MTSPKMRLRAWTGNRQPAFPTSFPATSFADHPRAAIGCSAMLRAVFVAAGTAALLLGSSTAAAEAAPDPAAAVASPSDAFAGFMDEASLRFGVPVAWIRAIIQVESGGDVNATSSAGAMGLMQIMPETWAGLRERYSLNSNPYDPHDNIIAGVAYVRELHDVYSEPGFLAAYNAGPLRYEDYLATGRALPSDTQKYLAILAPIVAATRLDDRVVVAAAARPWTEAPLFAVQYSPSQMTRDPSFKVHTSQRSTDMPAANSPAFAPQSNGLFVAVSRVGARS